MTIHYNIEELKGLMQSFYAFSGIRFILFDADFNRLVSYPEHDCAFCALMKKHPKTARLCAACDRRNLRECGRKDGMILYKCHAGLVEAATALTYNNSITGYLMFGQIYDDPYRTRFFRSLSEYCTSAGISKSEIPDNSDMPIYKSSEQIAAAAKIMEACTSYIMLKELIVPESDRIFEEAKKYIEHHLGEDFSCEKLCSKLQISRTRLYDIFQDEAHSGVAAYVRRRRMHRAKKLLKTTDKPVWEIAQSVGFPDYNYFSRVYKKTYGKSPKQYRT